MTGTESRFYKSMRQDWQKIQAAAEIVATGMADRLDGEGWKVYRVGSILRIDLA